MSKKFYIYLAVVLGFMGGIQPTYACLCDDSKQAAEPFDEAYEKASIVFIGLVKETLWKGPAISKTACEKDKCTSISNYIDPNAEYTRFDATTGHPGISYIAIFEVQKVWKDTLSRIVKNTVQIRAHAGGWCGIQFEVGKKYLVYARDNNDSKIIPIASVCSRTRPFEYGTDDFKLLNQ